MKAVPEQMVRRQARWLACSRRSAPASCVSCDGGACSRRMAVTMSRPIRSPSSPRARPAQRRGRPWPVGVRRPGRDTRAARRPHPRCPGVWTSARATPILNASIFTPIAPSARRLHASAPVARRHAPLDLYPAGIPGTPGGDHATPAYQSADLSRRPGPAGAMTFAGTERSHGSRSARAATHRMRLGGLAERRAHVSNTDAPHMHNVAPTRPAPPAASRPARPSSGPAEPGPLKRLSTPFPAGTGEGAPIASPIIVMARNREGWREWSHVATSSFQWRPDPRGGPETSEPSLDQNETVLCDSRTWRRGTVSFVPYWRIHAPDNRGFPIDPQKLDELRRFDLPREGLCAIALDPAPPPSARNLNHGTAGSGSV